MATEASDDRATLHARLSAALEAALGEAVWEIEGSYRCPEHGKVEAPYSSIVDMDYRCWRCGQALVVERRPVDWDDPAILWRRWERWEAAECREDRRHLVLFGYGGSTTPGRWGATVMGWVAQVYGPSAAAALATAWDALLAREVRDDD